MTREMRTYGLSEDALRERLADLLADTTIAVTLSFQDGHGIVTVTADPEELDDVVDELAVRMGGFIYSYEGESLAAAVVRLLTAHQLTVATAESCTGGLIAAALTDVPGASRVFGTGVVSYSNSCKERLLTVSSDTIATLGAVSAETAGQMARGVRQTADSHLGVSVTGEAGPLPAEDLPVGTVFIALADKKRTWVEELHLDGPDRDAIRRQAADRVLWLTWRYLAAHPAVMAGGESNQAAQKRTIPRGAGAKRPSIFSIFLPWRGDSRRRFWVKVLAWLAILAMLLTGLQYGYQHLIQPYRNRQLQSSLGDLYHQPTDLTDGAESPENYPAGLLPEFRGLYRRNPDIGGWIQIVDTQIDSPVMNYAEGYYSNHSFDKEYSIYGQLHFTPAGAKGVYAVYGKNTGDGQMFSDLMNYRRVAYLQEHSLIKCNTVYQTGTWQIYAVLVADENRPEEFRYVPQSWDGDGAFEQYIQQVRQRALVIGDQQVSQEDEFLILSTNAQQTYGFSGARLVVLAHRVTEAMDVIYRSQTYARMPAAYYKNYYTTTTVSTTGSTTKPTQTNPSVSTQPTDSTDAPPQDPTATDEDDVEPIDPDGDTVTTTQTTLPTTGTTIPTEDVGVGE